MNGIAEHFCDGGGAAKEMHLKPVGLLLRARFRVDPPDVCFGIGIRTSSHEELKLLQRSNESTKVRAF